MSDRAPTAPPPAGPPPGRAARRLRRAWERLTSPVRYRVRKELAGPLARVARLEAELAAVGDRAAGAAEHLERAVQRLDAEASAHAEAARRLGPRIEQLEGAVAGAAQGLLLAGRGPAAATAAPAGPPRISVVLPVHDRRALVGDAVRSVLAQTLADWELVIVDDGSTDGTPEALASFEADPRVVVVRTAHRGHAAARNLGLKRARGELVAYLDSDNALFPAFLEGMVAAFAREPALECAYGVLVADAGYFDGSPLLWRPFDRAALLRGNFIDLGSFVHRRRLWEELGGFDEGLTRLVDWDLILRYTERQPARPVPVLSVHYRSRADGRVTERAPYGPNWFGVRRKWLPHPAAGRGPRILQVTWPEAEPSEAWLLAERSGLERLGATFTSWRAPEGEEVGEALARAIAAAAPDVVHVHSVDGARACAPAVAAAGLPMTVRAHRLDSDREALRALLGTPAVRRLYLLPVQARLVPGEERVRELREPFDTARFRPAAAKDRRLVAWCAAGAPDEDPGFFLALARAAPAFRFVLAVAPCAAEEAEALRALAARLGSPAELRLSVSRDAAAELVARAGLYVEAAQPPDAAGPRPAGSLPVVEAMATGAYPLVRDLPALRELVGDAGAAYQDLDEALRLLEEALAWDDREWEQARLRAVDRAFVVHADETTLAPVLEDWCALAAEGRAARDGARLSGR